jgi:hypothetical protein
LFEINKDKEWTREMPECSMKNCNYSNEGYEQYKNKPFMTTKCKFAHICCPVCTEKIFVKREKNKTKTLGQIRLMLLEAKATYSDVSGSLSINEHITSEPKGFFKKLSSTSQNMYEIEAIIVIAFFALMHCSLMAAGVLILSNVMLYVATFDRDRRVIFGGLLQLALIGALCFILCTKFFMSSKITNSTFPADFA